MNEQVFEQKVKPILKYIGTIGAVLMAIAYIAIVLTMVFGFNASANIIQSLGFAAVNAVIGLIIMQFLKIQGLDLAKALPDNAKLIKQYYNTKTKDKKVRSLKQFWVNSFTKDILFKGISILATTVGVIYIVIRGTNEYGLLLLALVNLIMFFCFGLLSLVKAYDYINEEYVVYIGERINEANEETKRNEEEYARAREQAIEAEIQRRVDLAKKEFNKQTDNMVHADRGSNLLESSDSVCPVSSDNKPLVVDSDDRNNCVLGGAVYTRSAITDSTDLGA